MFDLVVTWVQNQINSLPKNKILDWSKLKAFADDNLNEIEKLKFVLGWFRLENMVGKAENAGFQHFLLFHTMFSKGLFLRGLLNDRIVVKG